jgi:16S rRNA processing protein RimM
MENLIAIGYTKKPHGLKGEIKVQVEDKYLEDLMETEAVLLAIKGKPTPFFLEDIRVGNAIIAKFEDVNSLEEAMSIASKEMFLRPQDILPDDLREMTVERLAFADCVGFTLFDKNEIVGTIEDVVEFPQQEMAVINYQNRELLIPLNEAFIQQIDKQAKRILMDLPEGLLDL